MPIPEDSFATPDDPPINASDRQTSLNPIVTTTNHTDDSYSDHLWRQQGQYIASPEGFFVLKKNVPIQLSNFVAVILAQRLFIESDTPARTFLIRARLADRLVEFEVDAVEFKRLTWVDHYLGSSAIIYPTYRETDHLATAIRTFSGVPREIQVHSATGWVEHNGQYVYRHAGGASGAHGLNTDITVYLDPGLDRIRLPEAPRGDQLLACIDATIRHFRVGPLRVTIPSLGHTFRAVVGLVDFALNLVGQSGSLKTEFAATLQQYFGSTFGSRSLPASFLSTANALERLTYDAKDTLVVLDDVFNESLQPIVERIVRAVGNQQGRGRMTKTLNLRKTYYPRCAVYITAEQLMGQASHLGRLLALNVDRDDFDEARLAAAKVDGSAGLYAGTMAAFIEWIAPRIDGIQANLATRIAEQRSSIDRKNAHRRTTDIINNLALGLDLFWQFAHASGVPESEYHDLKAATPSALMEAMEAQAEEMVYRSGAHAFVRHLSTLLAAGDAILEPRIRTGSNLIDSGSAADIAQKTSGATFSSSSDQDNGLTRGRIGFKYGNLAFVIPAKALEMVRRHAREIGEDFTLSEIQLKKDLYREGYLVEIDTRGGARRYECRRTIDGKAITVLLMDLQVLLRGTNR